MTLLDAALAYAAMGWPVFPCHPGNKQPLVKSETNGEGGFKLATTDSTQIRAWWTKYPKALIAVPDLRGDRRVRDRPRHRRFATAHAQIPCTAEQGISPTRAGNFAAP
jgi:hypothetical protein